MLHLLDSSYASLSEGAAETFIGRESLIGAMRRFVLLLASFLVLVGALKASTVPSGFSETPVTGPWDDAVGITFEANGRMWVWERTGKVWIKDPSDSSPLLLLDIHDEVGA